MISKFVGAAAIVCAAAAPLAAASAAPGDRAAIRSIALLGRVVDRRHTTYWRNWTIGFAEGRPFAEYSDEGTTLRGLRCAGKTSRPIACRIFMAMGPFESFPHFCEISPDGHPLSGHWPRRIPCPTVITFYRSATSTSSH